MPYIPHKEETIREMLREIGVQSIDELFSNLPQDVFSSGELNLPSGKSELDAGLEIHRILSKNKTLDNYEGVFAGGGVYYHYIPEPVKSLSTLPGFVTPYTPYQPEVSQGILTATFEYQTMVCELTGLDVANAGIYDGSTASAEAVLMGLRIGRGKRFFLSKGVNPLYRKVIRTYLLAKDYEIIELPINSRGQTDDAEILNRGDEKGSVFLFQSPNFYGIIEDNDKLVESVKNKGGIPVHTFTEPLSLSLLKSPGECGYEISAGEGQSFGIPPSFGGPYLGIFACKKEHLRQMPGRIAGQTVDKEGKRGFVFTLSTREQHIRREKATSNICSNVQLNTVKAAIYLSLMGASLKNLAKENLKRTHYLYSLLKDEECWEIPYKGIFFNEFVLRFKEKAARVRDRLLNEGFLGGVPLCEIDEKENEKDLLITVTEMCSKATIEKFADALKRVCR